MSSTISKFHQSPAQPESLRLDGLMLVDIVRKGTQRLLKEAVEAEVTEYLGCGRHEHGDGGASQPNGYRTTQIDKPSGPLEYHRPRLADAPSIPRAVHALARRVRNRRRREVRGGSFDEESEKQQKLEMLTQLRLEDQAT